MAQVSEPTHHAGAVGRALDSPAKGLVLTGQKTFGQRGQSGAQPSHGAVRALRPTVYVYRAPRRGTDQQRRRTNATHRGAMAQDQFRQPQRRGRNRYGALAHCFPNLPRTESQRAGLPRPRCLLLPARPASLLPATRKAAGNVNCYSIFTECWWTRQSFPAAFH